MASQFATRTDCLEVMASNLLTERSCCCSIGALPSVYHMLHHQTTRDPLYVHPAWWSDAHLGSLRVVVQSSPSVSSTPNILDSVYYLRLRRALPYFHSIQETIHQIACIIDSVQHPVYPAFPIFEQATPTCILEWLYVAEFANSEPNRDSYRALEFQLGQVKTPVKPCLHIEHHGQLSRSVPFLAYNNPANRRAQKLSYTRSRLTKKRLRDGTGAACRSADVEPFDVGVLLAMAQRQWKMLPLEKMFETYLLYPDDTGKYIHLLTAKISAEYLQCLRDPRLSLDSALIITHSKVVFSKTREEVLNLMHGILGAAPTVPKYIRPRRSLAQAKSLSKGRASDVKGTNAGGITRQAAREQKKLMQILAHAAKRAERSATDLPRLSMGVITRCKDQTHPGKQAFEPQPSLSAIPATSASKPSCASSGAS